MESRRYEVINAVRTLGEMIEGVVGMDELALRRYRAAFLKELDRVLADVGAGQAAARAIKEIELTMEAVDATQAEMGAATASVAVSPALDDTRAQTPLPLRSPSEHDNAVAGAGPPKVTGEMSASSGLKFGESADLTGVGSISATDSGRNVFEGQEGYETSGLYVRATSDATIRKLEEAGAELRNLLRELESKNEAAAEFELQMVVASVAGLVEMLERGALHLGLAHDSRTLLEGFRDRHPELYGALIQAGITLLVGLLIA